MLSDFDYYKLDARAYLQKFRTARRDIVTYYLDARNITMYCDLFDDVLLQQLQNSFPPDTQNFVMTRKPRTSEDAANFADLRSRITRPGVGNATQNPGGAAPPSQKKPNGNHHPQTHQQSLSGKGNGANIALNKRFARYMCGSPDHKRASCPMENQSIKSTRPHCRVCSLCGAYHLIGAPCYGRGQPGVYATEQCVEHANIVGMQFVVPLCV